MEAYLFDMWVLAATVCGALLAAHGLSTRRIGEVAVGLSLGLCVLVPATGWVAG